GEGTDCWGRHGSKWSPIGGGYRWFSSSPLGRRARRRNQIQKALVNLTPLLCQVDRGHTHQMSLDRELEIQGPVHERVEEDALGLGSRPTRPFYVLQVRQQLVQVARSHRVFPEVALHGHAVVLRVDHNLP